MDEGSLVPVKYCVKMYLDELSDYLNMNNNERHIIVTSSERFSKLDVKLLDVLNMNESVFEYENYVNAFATIMRDGFIIIDDDIVNKPSVEKLKGLRGLGFNIFFVKIKD